MYLSLDRADPLYSLKTSYYRRDLNPPHRSIRVSVSENESTRLLLMFLRIIVADKNDLDLLMSPAIGASHPSIRDAATAISIGNEQRAMLQLHSICEDYLAQYPTTFEHDMERLQFGNVAPFSNERNALIQVKGEKEVLLFFKDFSQTALELLHCTDADQFDRKLEQVRTLKHTIVYVYGAGVCSRLMHDASRRLEERVKSFDLSRPTVV